MASLQISGEFEIGKKNTGTGVFTPMITNDSSRLGYVAPASRTNPQEHDTHVIFGEGGVVDEKEVIQVRFKSDTDAKVGESEESKFFMEVTIQDKLTGKERTSALTFENMTGFTSGGTVDLTLSNADARLVAYFEVPANQRYKLGKRDGNGRAYAYIGDDTA